MRLSTLLFETLRNTPENSSPGAALLRRAGYRRGRGDWLPLGQLLRRRLLSRLADVAGSFGAAEVSLRLPAGRHARLNHLAGAFGSMLRSHRQLPRAVHRFSSGEYGLYTFSAGDATETEATLRESVAGLFSLAGLRLLTAAAGPGTTAFLVPSPAGAAEVLTCTGCGLSQLRETAAVAIASGEPGTLLPLEEKETPGADTIAALADFLGVPETATAKAVFLKAEASDEARLILVVLRGDLQLSEAKLGHALGIDVFRPATTAEIHAAGAEPGYGSPVGLDKEKVLVVADESVTGAVNLAAGANRPGWHLLNTNAGRDYEVEVAADIALADDGMLCPECGGVLDSGRADLLGSLFSPAAAGRDAALFTYMDGNNEEQPVRVAMFELDVDALLTAAAAHAHDDAGLIWPQELAPFEVILVPLGRPGSASAETADRLYGELSAAGSRVLIDDRTARPGVKFNDADLIGIPLRITVGDRGIEAGSLEGKWRRDGTELHVPLEGAAGEILSLLRS